MKQNDVYGIGNALVDMEFKVSDDFYERHGVEKGLMTLVDAKTQAGLLEALKNENNIEVKRQCGGSAANSMIAISQFGGKSFYSCKVANDDTGKFFLGDLEENGVRTQARFEDLRDGVTGKCMVMITPDAERTMHTYLGISAEFSKNEIREDELKNSKWLYIEGYLVASPTGQEAAVYSRKLAQKNNVKTALTFSDPNMVRFFKENISEIIGDGLDLIFCNEDEVMEFCETRNLLEAREKLKEFSKTFVITLGKNGAIIWDGTMFINIEPHRVEAIDSNGAGDMFAGAFLYALTHGHSMAGAGALASLASSKIVAQFGPRLSFPAVQDVLKQAMKGK